MAEVAAIGVLGQVLAALSNTPNRRWALKSIRLFFYGAARTRPVFMLLRLGCCAV